ncbi:MAG: exonuclease domain-containing protein, partial [Chloroflexota bacterium]
MATHETGWQASFSQPPEQTVMVALDLETTGVDPRNDQILEIGAVKFRGAEELDRFSSLVDPGIDIPPFITELTGIRKQDVAGAPRIEAVIPGLSEWLGDHPMIGHNVGFDAAFLRRNGVPPRLETFDTYDLAYALLPGAPEYNLGGLGKRFGLLHDSPHRALSDALATRGLFILLLERLRELDPALLAEFSRLTAASGWSAGILAGRVMDTMRPEQMRSALGPGAIDLEDLANRLRHRPRPQTDPPRSLDREAGGLEDAVASVFREGGHLARNLPDYEHRDEQERMARSVAKALEQGDHLVVEAGTGVGKSLAYLVPSALRAISNNSTILVSTNTINLQEQLLGKDIPAVEAVLGALGLTDDSLVSTQLKGRANYLCMRRWLHARSGTEMSVEEARLLAKTYVWLQETETGDRNELRLSRDDQSQFTRMSAQGANGCPPQEGPCFLRTARLRANNAHIVIINHSLLMSDLVMGGGLLPEHDALIIDEAHHLEATATRNLGFSIEQRQVEAELANLAGDRGLLADSLATLRSRAPLLAASGNLEALETRLSHTVSG